MVVNQTVLEILSSRIVDQENAMLHNHALVSEVRPYGAAFRIALARRSVVGSSYGSQTR